eukprot:749703-Pleurochrysis_carterae.AAC.2
MGCKELSHPTAPRLKWPARLQTSRDCFVHLRRPVVLALYGRANRKSIVRPEVAPSKIGASTSIVICQFIQYRMRTSCKRLRHTNARYGGAGQQLPTPLSRGSAQACGAAERPTRRRQHTCGLRRQTAQVWYDLGRVVEIPPFTINNVSAVEFLRAVLDSTVGSSIKDSLCLSEAVVLQLRRTLAFYQAVYAILASLHFKERVQPAPSTSALKRLANYLPRKERGKGFKGCLNRSEMTRSWPV